MTDTTYTDDLALELRLLDVPGVKIGEILAEIEAHVAETGEDPAEAFGPVSDYARERAGSLPEDQEGGFVARFMRDQWLQMIAGFLYSLLAASLLIGGILDLFIGGPTGPFGLPVWLAIALGVVLSVLWWVWFLRLLKPDRIIDPRSGQPVNWDHKGRRKPN